MTIKKNPCAVPTAGPPLPSLPASRSSMPPRVSLMSQTLRSMPLSAEDAARRQRRKRIPVVQAIA